MPRRYPNASPMIESAWRSQVVDLALINGWRAYFVENATREVTRRSGARVRARTVNAQGVGFPDLVLVRRSDARILFVELKRDHGAATGGEHPISLEQEAWLADLRAVALNAGQAIVPVVPAPAPIGVYVWRPADFDEVERVLR